MLVVGNDRGARGIQRGNAAKCGSTKSSLLDHVDVQKRTYEDTFAGCGCKAIIEGAQ